MEYLFARLALIVFGILFTSAVKGQQLQEGEWRTTDWSPCSQSCGSSPKRYRQVFCYRSDRRVQNSLCFGQRPTTVEECQAVDCPPERYELIECNKTCATGSALVWGCRFINREGVLVGVDLSKCNIDTLDKFHSCRDARSVDCPVYYYDPQPWSQCSATCGRGFQTRDVVCIKERKVSKEVQYDKCSHLKEPIKQLPCQIESCRLEYSYEYDVSNWSSCNTDCDFGEQHRRVDCLQRWTNGTKRIVNRSICTKNLGEEVKETQVCRAATESSCNWTLVSMEREQCGKGEVVFRISPRCENTETNDVVDDQFCIERHGKKPSLSEQPCLYRWHATKWSQCSASCGRGAQQRHVSCYTQFSNSVHGNQQTVPDSSCKHTPKPLHVQHCNIHACEAISSGQDAIKQDLGRRSCFPTLLFVLFLSVWNNF